MKKQFRFWWSLGVLAAILSMGVVLNAQQTQPQQPPGAQTPAPPTSDQPAPPPQPNGTDQASPANATQVFSGTIVKVGDRYMLRDETSTRTYDLDHQDAVQKYAGRQVRVHGTLDPNGKMIHLQ
jgi:uncharacterized protein YdeI (BOF family)